jgi:hypothetical protein
LYAVPDPAFRFDADPDPTFHSDADPDPDPTFRFYTDPDTDPTSQFSTGLDPLCSKMTLYGLHLFTLMRIRIQLSTLILIGIQLPQMMRIRNTANHFKELELNDTGKKWLAQCIVATQNTYKRLALPFIMPESGENQAFLFTMPETGRSGG